MSKDDLRIEAYGTLDELNVCIGALGSCAAVAESEDAAFLRTIQSDVFSWGSHLATVDPEMAKHLPPVPATRIDEMEAWMDVKNDALPPLSQFILPTGHPAVVAAHTCRVVCRRGERRVIALGRGSHPRRVGRLLEPPERPVFCVESALAHRYGHSGNSMGISALTGK